MNVPQTSADILHQLQEQERLSRFFKKLLGEAIFLKADKVEVLLEHRQPTTTLECQISLKGEVIKTIGVKPLWFSSIEQWLEAHAESYLSQHHSAETWKESPVRKDYRGVVRIDDSLFCYRVARVVQKDGSKSIALSEFSILSINQALEVFAIVPQSKPAWDGILYQPTGIIGVVVRDGETISAAVANILPLTNAHYLGDLSDAGVRESMVGSSSEHLLIVSIAADDPVEAVMKCFQYGVDLCATSWRGIVCTHFVKRVCLGCSKPSSPDAQLLKDVPNHLLSRSFERYSVGRGCDACGETGYRGWVGLQSIIHLSEPVISGVMMHPTQQGIIKAAAPRGTHSLFEDGILKVQSGLTTIESVRTVVKSAPKSFIEYWRTHEKVVPHEASSQANAVVNLSSPPNDIAAIKPKSKKANERTKILLVEDDDDQRAILELVLQSANYDVVQARNGVEGIAAVLSESPDLVISDLMMPIMDGSEFVSKLKSNTLSSHIPVLMLTMVSDDEKEYSLLSLGADDYCEKTIQRKLLLKRVENLVKRSRPVG